MIFGMANLTPKKTGLQVDIWSNHKGVLTNYENFGPRVIIGKRGQFEVIISIKNNPKILKQTSNIKKSDMDKIKEAIEYVGRNYDLFLKHFNDVDDMFDDDDLKKALVDRCEYKC